MLVFKVSSTSGEKKNPLFDGNCSIPDNKEEKHKLSTHICLRKSKQHPYDNDEIVSISTVTQDDVKQQLLIGHFYISKARHLGYKHAERSHR